MKLGQVTIDQAEDGHTRVMVTGFDCEKPITNKKALDWIDYVLWDDNIEFIYNGNKCPVP